MNMFLVLPYEQQVLLALIVLITFFWTGMFASKMGCVLI